MLTKDSSLTFVPGSPGRAFVPAVPAHPAYDEVRTVTERVFVCARHVLALNPYTGQEEARCVSGSWKNVTRTETIHHPATAGTPGVPGIPATPAQWLTNHKLGWNAGAHSVTRHPADCYVSFKVPASSAVIIGFNHLSGGVNFNEIAHGFYCGTFARVYESGAAKGEVFSFARTDTFIIERVNGVVTYYKNGARLYQSLVPSVGSAIVDASMYAGGDRID